MTWRGLPLFDLRMVTVLASLSSSNSMLAALAARLCCAKLTAFITDHSDALSRRAMLDPSRPIVENVVALNMPIKPGAHERTISHRSSGSASLKYVPLLRGRGHT